MADEKKTRQQLMDEVVELRRRVSGLEAREMTIGPSRDQIEQINSLTRDLLRRHDEWYRLLVEESFDGIFIQSGTKITFVNSRLCEMLGYEKEELQGRDHWVVYHPEYRGITRERAQARMRGEEVISRYEVKLQKKDGSSLDGEINAKALNVDGEPGVQVWVRDITEQKRTQDAVREAKEMLNAILSASPIGLAHIAEGKIQWANPAMCRLFGYELEEEWLGKNIRDFYSSKEEYQRVRTGFFESLTQGKPAETQAQFRRKDGSLFDGVIRINFVDRGNPGKGTITAIADISARKKAEAALQESEAMLRAILSTSPVGIGLSKERKMEWANEAWMEMFGFESEDECIGQSARILYPSQDEYERVGKAVYSPLETEMVTVTDATFRRKDGSVFDGRIRMRRLDPSKPESPTIAAITDITDRKMAEKLLVQSERLKAVADLSGGVAHNFNNLLQIIVGSADLALGDLEAGDFHEVRLALERILDRSRFGAQVVKALQAFTDAQSGRGLKEKKVFDLSVTAERAIELTRPWWEARLTKEGATIFFSRNFHPDCLVEGNEGQFLEVMVSLIKNAAEALPKGGEIRITAGVEHGEVVLRVQDDGIGIAKENLDRLFEPFFTTKGPQTVGMGLAGALGIVKGHGGEILVESKQGKGSLFTVRLPLAQKPFEAQAPVESAAQVELNILVVDDLEPLVGLLKGIFTKYGQKVSAALSGEEAIRLYKEIHFDLVICDLAMPHMDGWQVGEAIKNICTEKRIPKTPFILLTGWGGQALEKEKIIQSGVDGVVGKPLDIKGLMATVRQVVEKAEARKSSMGLT